MPIFLDNLESKHRGNNRPRTRWQPQQCSVMLTKTKWNQRGVFALPPRARRWRCLSWCGDGGGDGVVGAGGSAMPYCQLPTPHLSGSLATCCYRSAKWWYCQHLLLLLFLLLTASRNASVGYLRFDAANLMLLINSDSEHYVALKKICYAATTTHNSNNNALQTRRTVEKTSAWAAKTSKLRSHGRKYTNCNNNNNNSRRNCNISSNNRGVAVEYCRTYFRQLYILCVVTSSCGCVLFAVCNKRVAALTLLSCRRRAVPQAVRCSCCHLLSLLSCLHLLLALFLLLLLLLFLLSLLWLLLLLVFAISILCAALWLLVRCSNATEKLDTFLPQRIN